jgi:DNA-binding NtrC family response regulator
MELIRVLFVDDEPGIRITMPHILRRHGLSVRAVGTVNHALAEIASAKFNVLISDLNIGHPTGGLIVVNAMRRTQPNCVTLILTGYPMLDVELDAIRCQVDGCLIKPAKIPSLMSLIREKLQQCNSGGSGFTKRTA